VVGVGFGDVERFEPAVDEVADVVVAAMQPVRPAIATTLSQPATRRARRAGCGRFRRGDGFGDIGHSW
jgi:hypothetical protein